MKLNKERAPRNNKKHDYLLKGLLVCGCCQLRMIGHAGILTSRKRRYLCTQKETLHTRPQRCPNRTVQAEIIEALVWASVSELLSDPQLLLAQYQLRQVEGDGTPQQQEQRRLERRLTALERETQRLLDAYQADALELAELKERRTRIQEEQARVRQRMQELQGQEADQQRRQAIEVSVEEFCRTMEDALVHPSFETKQKILRLVVDSIEFQEDQITIKHLIPVGNVRLCRNQYGNATPIENEQFNVHKNHGYELEHNYGHGARGLSYVLYLLNLLAFLAHEVLDQGDRFYRTCRANESRRSLWNALRVYFRKLVCTSWQEMLEFHLRDEPVPDT